MESGNFTKANYFMGLCHILLHLTGCWRPGKENLSVKHSLVEQNMLASSLKASSCCNLLQSYEYLIGIELFFLKNKKNSQEKV